MSDRATCCTCATKQPAQRRPTPGRLVLNDDGYVFLYLNDDLQVADLRRYLRSYCRPGVDTVAYCVGDMSWPALYPTRVGEPRRRPDSAGSDLRRARAYRNAESFAAEPGGYFGTAFAILHELGKKVVASFRMNDAHFTSPDNPDVSAFWKQHADLALGAAYGYYGGCLNYTAEVVREHFFARVMEFAELHPEIDGIELDALRSPYFFPPGEGQERAPLFTALVRRIKEALAAQARRLQRPDYLLSTNVPLTPEVALESGLDVAAWDAEGLFDGVGVGPYQAYMNHPMERWKELLRHGTPVYAYVNCSPQTGQYLGLEEYRAAAANAYGGGADGIYLFNYPCLFELAAQLPVAPAEVTTALPDMRPYGHSDFTRVAQALDELGNAAALADKDKHFLFYCNNDTHYRHHDPDRVSLARQPGAGPLRAVFRCYEDYAKAEALNLFFKVENVARSEQFEVRLNDTPLPAGKLRALYAANGRDTRIHTVALGPYLLVEVSLGPRQLRRGENVLEVTPTQLVAGLTVPLRLAEIELRVAYGQA
jgi:hypothetical protein